MNEAQSQLTVTCEAGMPSGWDDFVMECEPAHYEQTSWWASVESEDGWTAKYIVCREGIRIVAGAMVLVRRRNRIGLVGYVFRGPLVRRDLTAPARAQRPLIAGLKRLARGEHLVVLIVVPPYDGDELARALLDQGFMNHPRSLPPCGLPLGTLTVDLRQGYEAIEQRYRRTTKWEIKRAVQKGLDVQLGAAQDLETFWSRHQDLCRRRGVISNVPGFEYACRVWREFHQHGRAWMFNAVLDGKVLCSLICLAAGNWFYAWRIGWTATAEKVYPTQTVFARAIQAATEAGYHFFDFMAIDPDDAVRLERGEEVRTTSSGMTFFKMGFGGKIRTLPPTLDWFPNPLLRLLMRGIGRRILSASFLTQKFAKYTEVQ